MATGEPRDVDEEAVVGQEEDLARPARLARPRAVDVVPRGEPTYQAPRGAAEHRVDQLTIGLGSRRLARFRLEEREDLRAAAEPEHRRRTFSHGPVESTQSSFGSITKRVPPPAGGRQGVRYGLARVVPVVRAREDDDGRWAAAREEAHVERWVVPLDGLEHFAGGVAGGRVQQLASRPERARNAVVSAERGDERRKA